MTFKQIFNAILFYRRTIIKITLLSAVILYLILFFAYPITFEATVSVLPPETSSSSGLGSLLAGGDLSNIIAGKGGSASSQLYLEIIKSRSAAEYVVKKLNLTTYYKTNSVQVAAQRLSNSLNAEVTKEGIIKISSEVSTPMFSRFSVETDSAKSLSAKIPNAFVEALDYINRDKLVSKAKKTRIYLEEQIKITKAQLDSSEVRLMDFQKQNKAISLPEQLKASIDNAAKLKSEIVSNEIQLGLLSGNLKEDNDVYIALKTKIDQLKSQYSKMDAGDQDYLLSFKDVPEFGLKLASLMRDAKIYNEVYLLLQQQYYREKIQENKDLPTVEILDNAIEPMTPKGPRVLFSTAMGAFFVFLLMSFAVVLVEKKNLKVK